MNKLNNVLIKIFIILIFFLIPINVNAKTLNEIKNEYNELEKKYNNTENNKKITESEINSAKNRIESIYDEMSLSEEEIQKITNEITKLNEQISEKENQTKELMKFFQVSSNESSYLEYIFSADSITDFIYRISVTEQLSKYNNNLIKEMHTMIDKNNKNIESLHKKEENLKI